MCIRDRNRADKDGIITVNPTKEFDFADKVKAEASRREYLTMEELRLLIATECKLSLIHIQGILHEEVYHDYTKEDIDRIYRYKESLPENHQFINCLLYTSRCV